MTEASPTPSHNSESNPESIAGRHRMPGHRLIAGATLAGVLIGGVIAKNFYSQDQRLDRLSASSQAKDDEITNLQDIVAGVTGVSRDTVEGKGLKSVETLPGYGREVPAPEQQLMRAATVQVVARSEASKTSPAGEWFNVCTGLKIGSGANTYIVMAGHCAYMKGSDLKGGGGPETNAAQNITQNLADQYGIQPIHADNTPGAVVPVTDMSKSNTVDWALMKVDMHSSAAEAFRAMPTVSDYESRLFDPEPVPGEAMAVFSLPQAAGGKVLLGKGIYLGTITDPTDDTRQLEFVGLRNADMPAQDACNYGSSGSTALSASGHLTGPLALRNNINYIPGSPANDPDNPQFDITYRLKLEAALKLNLNQFDTICGYSAPNRDTISDLESGFDNPAPLVTQLPIGGMK